MLVLVAGACGDDGAAGSADAGAIDDGGTTTDAANVDAMPTTLASFCASDGLFGRYYARLISCYPEVELDLGFHPTNDDLRDWCLGMFGDFIGDGSMALPSEQTINECLDYMDNSLCIDTSPERPRGPCAELFVGTIAVGQGCEWEFQCAGAAYCARDSGRCGTCAAKKTLGQGCNSSEHCESLACDDGVCVTPGLEGSQCSSDKACLGQRYCDKATSRCAAPAPTNYLAIGADCLGGGECDPIAYATCDAGTGKCIAPTTSQLGQACSSPAGLKCTDDLRCSDAEAGGTCVVMSQEGDGCGSDDDCGGFLNCENNECSYNSYDGTCTSP